MGRLAGKITIITGAAKGLGEAGARMFVREAITISAATASIQQRS